MVDQPRVPEGERWYRFHHAPADGETSVVLARDE
jgi:hypothetical protein